MAEETKAPEQSAPSERPRSSEGSRSGGDRPRFGGGGGGRGPGGPPREGGGAVIHELERRLRVTEPVIKFLTVRIDEEQKRLDKIKRLRDAHKKVSAQPAAAAAEEPAAPAAEAPATA
jgi:hypothetical protein